MVEIKNSVGGRVVIPAIRTVKDIQEIGISKVELADKKIHSLKIGFGKGKGGYLIFGYIDDEPTKPTKKFEPEFPHFATEIILGHKENLLNLKKKLEEVI